jgi:hypothetical protein
VCFVVLCVKKTLSGLCGLRISVVNSNARVYACAYTRPLARAARDYIDIIDGFVCHLVCFCAAKQWYALRTYLHFPQTSVCFVVLCVKNSIRPLWTPYLCGEFKCEVHTQVGKRVCMCDVVWRAQRETTLTLLMDLSAIWCVFVLAISGTRYAGTYISLKTSVCFVVLCVKNSIRPLWTPYLCGEFKCEGIRK